MMGDDSAVEPANGNIVSPVTALYRASSQQNTLLVLLPTQVLEVLVHIGLAVVLKETITVHVP